MKKIFKKFDSHKRACENHYEIIAHYLIVFHYFFSSTSEHLIIVFGEPKAI